MVKENILGQMVMSTLEIGRMIKCKGLEDLNIFQQEEYMKVIGVWTKWMVKVNLQQKIILYILEIMWMTLNKVLANTGGQIIEDIEANGKMEFNMGKVNV